MEHEVPWIHFEILGLALGIPKANIFAFQVDCPRVSKRFFLMSLLWKQINRPAEAVKASLCTVNVGRQVLLVLFLADTVITFSCHWMLYFGK